MYGGSGVSPCGSPAVQPQAPAAFAEVLEQLDRAVAAARPEAARRARERFPDVAVEALEQEHLAARRRDRDARRHDARVVHDDELAAAELVRQLGEAAMPDRCAARS